MVEPFENNGDPDQMPHSVTSDLGLHCLAITLLGVSKLQWVNRIFFSYSLVINRRQEDKINFYSLSKAFYFGSFELVLCNLKGKVKNILSLINKGPLLNERICSKFQTVLVIRTVL